MLFIHDFMQYFHKLFTHDKLQQLINHIVGIELFLLFDLLIEKAN